MAQFKVSIKGYDCTQCKKCIEICKVEVFGIDPFMNDVVVENEEKCTGCMECINICEPHAITLEDAPEGYFEEKKSEQQELEQMWEEQKTEIEEKQRALKTMINGRSEVPIQEVLDFFGFTEKMQLDVFLNDNEIATGIILGDTVQFYLE